MKSIIVLLLLILFFLSGMLFGVERDRAEIAPPKVETANVDKGTAASQGETIIQTSEVDKHVIAESSEYKQTSTHFTQKTASFFESIVKGFYEVVVQMIYQIVQLFY
ncbi:hypothetical protein [Virgibacillus sp. DJP39]|uniref:hypothetical protein n=1 Tax=Virgibacillus sp. DJP39 TaxID=3409790 RepID=UPI003BB80E27